MIAAQTSGNVTSLKVRAGQPVQAGETLALIDGRQAQSSVQQSQAAIAQAQAQWQQAKLSFDRAQSLFAQGFISQASLDAARSTLTSAQAARQQATASNSQAVVGQSFGRVEAPYSAVVSATHVQTGELAVPGRPLLTLYDPRTLRAVVAWPNSRTVPAQLSQIRLRIGPSTDVQPTAVELLPAVDPESQTRTLRLQLPPSAVATPGQSVRVSTVQEDTASSVRQQILVPVSAIVQRGELTGVYVVQQQRLVLRAVRIGPLVNGQRVILAGLKPTERIAVDAMRASLAGATP